MDSGTPLSSGDIALVTGASGFVGSHLVESLVAHGWHVRALLRTSSNRRWLPVDRIEVALGDVSDAASLGRAVRGATTVFHLAAATSAARREDYMRANVDGTRRVCEAIAAHNPDAALVYCSSLAAGGPSLDGRPLTEADPPHPITTYGISKLEGERVVTAASLRSVIVRPPAVYGPRDRDVLAAFRLAAHGLAFRLGPRDQPLSMLHVRDLAQGLLDAATRGIGNGTYYVNGGTYAWSAIVETLGTIVGRRVREVSVPLGVARLVAAVGQAAYRVGLEAGGRAPGKPLLTPGRVRDLAQPGWACSDARARAELGYLPRIGLSEGMRETAEWYRSQGWLAR